MQIEFLHGWPPLIPKLEGDFFVEGDRPPFLPFLGGDFNLLGGNPAARALCANAINNNRVDMVK